MTNETLQSDVVIAGGGMVGMTLAIALAKAGLAVTVIEREPWHVQTEAKFDGRVSAIAHGSERILTHLGIWEHMQPAAEPILDIRVTDGNSPFFVHYDHHEVGNAPFGYIVENRVIRQALQTVAVQCSRLQVLSPASVESMACDAYAAQVTLADGRIIKAKLIVGADGKNSKIRKLAGIKAHETAYEHAAIVCTIKHEKPHHGLAQERFLAVGPFAVLPMQNNHSSLVWTEKNPIAAAFLKLPEKEFTEEIAKRVGGYLGAITPVGPRFSYPLGLLHAKQYVAERVALVGDAAHAIHPIAGQGVNLGFRDVAVLAELVEDAFALGLDIGAAHAISRYERWRRFDTVLMIGVTDGLTRLFSNNILPLRIARDIGLWAVGKMPPLKRYFMRHAMGIEGDLPKLMKESA